MGGGSWFRNCGSAGNANLDHTWYEGIQVCQSRPDTAIGQQLYGVQQNNIHASINGTEVVNSKDNTPITMSTGTSNNVPMTDIVVKSASTSITTQGYEKLLNGVGFGFLLII